MFEVKDSITLLPEEKELFNILLETTRFANTGTVLRCAGGWVRDKLIGKDSPDIDIALDNMLGKDFADKVNEYLASLGKDSRPAAVIQSNPDQSKHLETARMKIGGMWIDLVNLRSETYASNSRIPEMKFGTAEEDALRRDFTINSMFYNLNENRVEDFTKRGLDDLRAGVIRTPLPPLETFLDDPLRVLRGVRFATRFSYTMEYDLVQAASSPKVRDALATKVSRERIGTELELMLNGPDPVAAVMHLHRLRLLPAICLAPANLYGADEGAATLAKVDWGGGAAVTVIATDQIASTVLGQEKLSNDDRRVLLTAGMLLPLRGGPMVTAAKGKPVPLPTFIVRESFKWRTKDADTVAALHDAAPKLVAIAEQLRTDSSRVPDSVKVSLGLLVRSLKQNWKLGALLAPVVTTSAAAVLEGGNTRAELGVTKLARTSRTLIDAVHALELDNCWEWKPLLDGPKLIQELGLSKGPAVGKAAAAAMEWQLSHPKGTASACLEHLRSLGSF